MGSGKENSPGRPLRLNVKKRKARDSNDEFIQVERESLTENSPTRMAIRRALVSGDLWLRGLHKLEEPAAGHAERVDYLAQFWGDDFRDSHGERDSFG